MQKPTTKFSNLHKLSFGDETVKEKLLENFFSSTESAIKGLKEAIEKKDSSSWRNLSHQIKSMAVGLGAENLGAISLEAEKSYMSAEKLKQDLLVKITRQVALLKQ